MSQASRNRLHSVDTGPGSRPGRHRLCNGRRCSIAHMRLAARNVHTASANDEQQDRRQQEWRAGQLSGASAPMKYAKVSVNRNGPTIWATLCTLDVAPCNCPCSSAGDDLRRQRLHRRVRDAPHRHGGNAEHEQQPGRRDAKDQEADSAAQAGRGSARHARLMSARWTRPPRPAPPWCRCRPWRALRPTVLGVPAVAIGRVEHEGRRQHDMRQFAQ